MSESPEEARDREETQEDVDVTSLIVRALELSEAALESAESAEDDADVAQTLDELQTVANEAAELIEAMDLEKLPEAIDAEDADEVIDEEALPEAIENLDPTEAIRIRKLLAVIDIGTLWDSVDVRDVWRNKRELEDALEALDESAEDGDGEGLPLVDELTDVADEDEGDGLVDADDDLVDVDAGDVMGMGDDGDDDAVDVPDEAYQTAIQSQLADSVDVFRKGLVGLHEELERLREENRERIDRTGQPDSRNPTAYSTLTAARTSANADTRHSTVPAESKYSNAPNRPRIYGTRFENYGDEEDDDA